MADLLLTFGGRIGRLGYFFSLMCMAIVIVFIFMLQRALGDWKFGSIFIIAASALPLIIYISGTAKRFQDRGRHPLLGFFLYYIIPAGLFYGAYSYSSIMPGDGTLFPEGILKYLQNVEWTPQMIAFVGSVVVASLLLIYGQISLFLRKGSASENVFDEGTELGVSV